MNYRDFGKTGIKVSEVGFGAWAIGGNEHGISYGPVDDKDSLQAIEKALELGCNFFDTADVYGWGHSEELLGTSLKSMRDRVVVATKVGSDFYQGYGYQSFTSDYIDFALRKSMSRLKTDYIDVYQLHNPPEAILENNEAFTKLRELKKEGKIRAWGISVTTLEEALLALSNIKPDSLQVPMNIFSNECALEVLTKAEKLGCALIAREPLANGFLSGKYRLNSSFPSGDIRHNWPLDYINARVKAAESLKFLGIEEKRTLAQAAIQWVLKHKEVAVAIAGIKDKSQALENMSAMNALPLSKSELKLIEDLKEERFGL